MSKAKLTLFSSIFMGLTTWSSYTCRIMGRRRIKAGAAVRLLLPAVLLVLLGYGLTVVYYFIPWSASRHVYSRWPALHRSLMLTGYRIVDGVDGLGLWGRDRSVVLPQHRGGAHVYGGYPDGRVHLLENSSYAVGYSENLKNPLWVAYRVFDVPELRSGERPAFRTDRRTRARVTPDAYRGSGYDRGHMAPNFAMATRYGLQGQAESFLMSNIIPQTPRINRYLWKELEMRVARRYSRCFDEVWVVTGPVFSKPVQRLASGVAVPSAYYKIVTDEIDGGIRVMAFLVDSRAAPYTRIKTELVSVDQLEALTGLNFFPELTESEQQTLEAEPAGRLWPWIPSVWF